MVKLGKATIHICFQFFHFDNFSYLRIIYYTLSPSFFFKKLLLTFSTKFPEENSENLFIQIM
jgi:hypothetical protein